MIEDFKILPDSLHVKFKNKLDDNFLNIWLRDHAKDNEIGIKEAIKEKHIPQT